MKSILFAILLSAGMAQAVDAKKPKIIHDDNAGLFLCAHKRQGDRLVRVNPDCVDKIILSKKQYPFEIAERPVPADAGSKLDSYIASNRFHSNGRDLTIRRSFIVEGYFAKVDGVQTFRITKLPNIGNVSVPR